MRGFVDSLSCIINFFRLRSFAELNLFEILVLNLCVFLGLEQIVLFLDRRNLLLEHVNLVFEGFDFLFAYAVAEKLRERNSGRCCLPSFKIQCVFHWLEDTSLLILSNLLRRVILKLFVVSLGRHVSRFGHDTERTDSC